MTRNATKLYMRYFKEKRLKPGVELTVQRCLECSRVYLFKLDVEEHRTATGHRDFIVISDSV